MFRGAKRSAQNDVVHRYVDLILKMAVDDGVDKMIFGEPCDGLPRETCVMEPFLPAEMIAELNSMKDVPIWRRVNGTWHELPGFSWYLLHEVVRDLGDKIVAQHANKQQATYPNALESIVPLKSKHGGVKVAMTLTLEPNYCYSVTLKKID
ncbi:MAG: hypothetical protein ABSD58_11560 [Verrucomicrobiia bacterium]|jgi:hypothetical protein